jgi:regulator of protease activity HflC (stomatin/prohibitin superfamily)
MANNKKGKASTSNKKAVNKKKPAEVEEEDVETEEEVEEETTADEAEEETTEEATEETAEEESEDEEAEAEEESEDAVDEDEIENEVEDADVTALPVTKFAVYKNNVLVKVFNSTTHGKEFKDIAKGLAKRLQEANPGDVVEAKVFVDPSVPEVDPNSVTVVNASKSVIRVFTLVSHGKNYKEIADAFIEKHGVKRGYRIL